MVPGSGAALPQAPPDVPGIISTAPRYGDLPSPVLCWLPAACCVAAVVVPAGLTPAACASTCCTPHTAAQAAAHTFLTESNLLYESTTSILIYLFSVTQDGMLMIQGTSGSTRLPAGL